MGEGPGSDAGHCVTLNKLPAGSGPPHPHL